MCPSTHNMDVPAIKRTEYQVSEGVNTRVWLHSFVSAGSLVCCLSYDSCVYHNTPHPLCPPQVLNISSDQYMTLMSDNGDIREDLRVPENDTGKEIDSKFESGEEFMVSDPLLETGSDCRGHGLTAWLCVAAGVCDPRHG